MSNLLGIAGNRNKFKFYLVIENISHITFRKRFMTSIPEGFSWQQTPVQVYPLSIMSDHVKTPTPLLKTEEYLVVCLEKGAYEHQLGSVITRVQSPAIVFIQAREFYAVKQIEDNLKGYFMIVQPKSITALTQKDLSISDVMNIQKVLKLNKEQGIWIHQLFELLYQEIRRQSVNRKVGTGLLKVLFLKLLEFSGENQTPSRQREIANQFQHLINTHFKNEKQLDFYADQLNVSKNYLNRCVKGHFGKSCKTLVQEVSILQSQILMFELSDDITEIAFAVGYDDPSYFSRVFKKVTGISPTTFKKQIMHD